MMTEDALSFEAKVLNSVEARPEGITEKELSSQFDLIVLKPALSKLAENGAVEKRPLGGITTWYPLFKDSIKKVLIVEDDKNINNLMKASLGKGYEIAQSFDGNDALAKIESFKPDLVLLDLMLPGPDGIEICRRIKTNEKTMGITVIIVSAADERRSRFVGIKEGADYYVKKPFEPRVLRALTNIFLRKRGRKFDPLVDLPDTERLSKEIEQIATEEDFEVNNIRILGLPEFTRAHGDAEANAVVRLVSQIIQDKVRDWASRRGFVGYIGDGEFVVCGGKNESSMVVSEVATEFERVVPFIYQEKDVMKSAKQPPTAQLDLAELLSRGSGEFKRVSLKADVIPLERIMKKREEITGKKEKKELGDYTFAELKELFGSSNLDLAITRTPKGVQMGMSKGKGE